MLLYQNFNLDMFKIGDLNIESNIFLAPMAGVTDNPFRTICKEYGAGVVFTEFVSANGIIRENDKTLNMIKFDNNERPIGIQIFGESPTIVSQSAKYIENKFNPDIIDINFGCPVPKVTKKGAGSGAMKNLDLMGDIVDSVIGSVRKTPITVKMRSGWSNDQLVYLEAGKILEDIGISAITLHARTTKQQFTGSANWGHIKKLKDVLSIPVIGNGDVKSLEDYNRMKSSTGCDAVMIGRASLGNPWIFKELQLNRKISPTPIDIANMCTKHFELLKKYYNTKISLNLSKKHFGWYLKGFSGASVIRKKIMRSSSLNEIEEIISYFRSSI